MTRYISAFQVYLRIPVASLLIVLNFSLIVPSSEPAYIDNFTHALFDQHFTAVWCPACRSEEPDVLETYNELAGSFYVVSFHIVDQLSNDEGNAKIIEYQARTLPYHVYDGGSWFGKGRISTTNMQDPATRPVHGMSLAVAKTIQGSTLEYIGSVQELDDEEFTGYVQVYITENKVEAQGIEWNFVFRVMGIKKDLNMAPGEIVQFSGEWTIPSEVESKNILVVAAVFDTFTVGHYGPYTVQAVDDNRSGQVIPEIMTPSLVALIALSVTLMAVYRMKRRVNE